MGDIQHLNVAQHLPEFHAAGFIKKELLVSVRSRWRINGRIIAVEHLADLFFISIDLFRLLPCFVHAHEKRAVRARQVVHGIDVRQRLPNERIISSCCLALTMPCAKEGIIRASALDIMLPLPHEDRVQFVRSKDFIELFTGQQVRGFLRQQIIGGLVAQMVRKVLANLLKSVCQFVGTLLQFLVIRRSCARRVRNRHDALCRCLKDAVEGVIVARADRIELVIVAAGA